MDIRTKKRFLRFSRISFCEVAHQKFGVKFFGPELYTQDLHYCSALTLSLPSPPQEEPKDQRTIRSDYS